MHNHSGKFICAAWPDNMFTAPSNTKPQVSSMTQDVHKDDMKRLLLTFLFDACYVDHVHAQALSNISVWIDEWIDDHFSATE